MTMAGDSRVQFSESEQVELADYRPLNRFALFSLLVGIISGLALAHKVLCILPVGGIILAILALRQLHSSDNRQSGHSLAVIGLGLSVLFGSWAIARETSRELQLYAQARQFSEEWFALLRAGKFHEAHQLTLPEEHRVAAGASLQHHYKKASPTDHDESHHKDDPDHKDHAHHKDDSHPHSHAPSPMEGMMDMMVQPHVEFEQFFTRPAPQRLRALGSQARYEFQENLYVLNTGATSVEVQLSFAVRNETDANAQAFSIKITLARYFKPGVAADWRVTQVDF